MGYSSSQRAINERTERADKPIVRTPANIAIASPKDLDLQYSTLSIVDTISLRRSKHIAPKTLGRSSPRLFDGSSLSGFPFSRMQFCHTNTKANAEVFLYCTLPDVPKPPSSVTKISCTVQQEEFFHDATHGPCAPRPTRRRHLLTLPWGRFPGC